MSPHDAIERTIFTAVLVQDSALSVSGIDAPHGDAGHTFTRVDGVPVISARGLKGAAVAMARRCFHGIPRSVSDLPEATKEDKKALVRSAWRFEHARQLAEQPPLQRRAGVGIRQDTGARAQGVLYDMEVAPAGSRWQLELHVDWRLARAVDEAPEDVEGILGYVLDAQWAEGRCWLGGGVARGLGWCHLERGSLRAHRLTGAQYQAWRASQARPLPAAEPKIPRLAPTRSWCFRALELTIPFGEHRPAPGGAAWGLEMLAIGGHDRATASQLREDRHWVRSRQRLDTDDARETQRPIAMEEGRPLLPGASLRGPLRHAYSRQLRSLGKAIADPHDLTRPPRAPDEPSPPDEAMALFGTLERSSRLLIRDGVIADDWLAARLQQHAEDEFTAGSFASAKRDAVRLLAATFKVQLLLEGPDEEELQRLVDAVDGAIALGELGHLPLGGHKTRGAGWSRWQRGSAQWQKLDVVAAEAAQAPAAPSPAAPPTLPAGDPVRHEREHGSPLGTGDQVVSADRRPEERATVELEQASELGDLATLTLGEAARRARAAMTGPLSCWWCEPRIDLEVQRPLTFGHTWPDEATLSVDEVVFFGERESWRAARTRRGWRAFLLRVVDDPKGDLFRRDVPATLHVVRRDVPAALHVAPQARFSANLAPTAAITLHEWRKGTEVLGFTAKGPLP